MPHPSVDSTLEDLKDRATNSPFLALGQTVFWDEPVKAAWRRMLDIYWPSAQLIAGIHDTDYFAKTTAHVPDDREFIALPHDDGATRGLWSAAGEISALLGSEDLPTRSFYESLGIPFNRLAGRDYSDRRRFFEEYTNAYGWRGIVQTAGTPQIAHDVQLHYFGPALLQLLDWCFDESLSNLDEETAAKGRNTAETVRSWAATFLESCRGDSTLTDLYQHLLPKFYELLLQFEPSNFSVTSTVSLLRFNQTTAQLPRFSFVGIFLEPSTRDVAKSAYSKAVAGGGMYALDHFGPNALPFDVVVPGVGRGTLHVEGSHVTVDFQPVPITVEATEPITTVGALAEVLAGRFGDLVVLVGKAVSLISMLSAEYILIFHETASGYTTRTTEMNEALRAKGVVLKLNPIVRLQYRSWDSLAGITESRLRLPKHLDNSFGLNGQSISANDFAVRWRTVIASQRNRIEALKQARSLRQVIRHLEDNSDHEHWLGRLEALNRAILSIKSEYDASADVRAHIDGLKARINSLKLNRTDLEARSGDARRARQAGLAVDSTEIENVEMYKRSIDEITRKRQHLQRQLKDAIAAKRASERSKIVTDARKLINEIDFEASTAKLQSARSAFLTTEGLPHINSRPTAWWLPMVDPTGTWFDNIADSVEARLEEV